MQLVVAALAAAAALALCTAQTVPTFPVDWTANEVDSNIIHQGQVTTEGQNICCPIASNCQVQLQYQSGVTSFDYTNQRVRFDIDGSGGQAVVSLFKINKQMLVQMVNGSWTCQSFCPLDEGPLTPYSIDPNSTMVGQKVVNNITCDDWQIVQYLIPPHTIPMQSTDVFVDNSGSQPIPVQEVDQLTPFGQNLGTMTSTWTNYAAGEPNPALFDIAGIKGCPESNQCGDDTHQLQRLRLGHFKTWLRYFVQNNKGKIAPSLEEAMA